MRSKRGEQNLVLWLSCIEGIWLILRTERLHLRVQMSALHANIIPLIVATLTIIYNPASWWIEKKVVSRREKPPVTEFGLLPFPIPTSINYEGVTLGVE